MPETKIDYKDKKGFWIEESFMQLCMYYIYLELQNNQYVFANKTELLEDLNDKLNGLTKGYLVLEWDDILINITEEQTMCSVLNNVKLNLMTHGAYLTVSNLQAIPLEDKDLRKLYSKKPFPVSELIKIVNALIQMLEGTWTSTNYGMDINYGHYD